MELAADVLEIEVAEHDGILVYAKRYPFLRLLQTDPRIERVYRCVGFPPS